MDKKLTLSLDQKLIEKAKAYAKSNNTSLSRLIESYLTVVVQYSNPDHGNTPIVNSLIGVIELPDDVDEKEIYTEYLIEKHK